MVEAVKAGALGAEGAARLDSVQRLIQSLDSVA
jgi:hypothetical protein